MFYTIFIFRNVYVCPLTLEKHIYLNDAHYINRQNREEFYFNFEIVKFIAYNYLRKKDLLRFLYFLNYYS